MRIEGFSVYLCGYVTGILALTGMWVFADDPRFSKGVAWLVITAPMFGFLYLPVALVAFVLVRVPSTLPRYIAHVSVVLGTLLAGVAIQLFRGGEWGRVPIGGELTLISTATIAVALALRAAPFQS
jgi:hypothetical protein